MTKPKKSCSGGFGRKVFNVRRKGKKSVVQRLRSAQKRAGKRK